MTQKAYDGLPEFCFSTLATTDEVILIKRYERGYYPYYDGAVKGEDKARECNEKLGITPAQVMAMETGSMVGWSVPGANPDSYNEDGSPK